MKALKIDHDIPIPTDYRNMQNRPKWGNQQLTKIREAVRALKVGDSFEHHTTPNSYIRFGSTYLGFTVTTRKMSVIRSRTWRIA